MKPGRLPENHPLEQRARDQLREPSPEAQAKRAAQQQQSTIPVKPAPQPRRRWD